MLSVITDDAARSELVMSLDELAREGARRMLAAALEAEVDAYIAGFAALTDERGHRLVRRNGHAPARQLATGAGQVEVVRPRVDDRRVDSDTGQRMRFHSQILPRWCRRSPKVAEVLPLLYLHGLSSSDFVPALEELFGSAAGLSASVITRLTQQWQAEREAFQRRDLAGVDYVYCFADGVHFSIRRAPSRASSSRLITSSLRAASSAITLNMSRRSFLPAFAAPASFLQVRVEGTPRSHARGSSTGFDDSSTMT